MQPIKKLNIVFDLFSKENENIDAWQYAINTKGDEKEFKSLVEQSKEANANGKNLWDSLPKEKKNLQQQLYEEQNGICCYCGQKLTLEEVVIEHLNPKKDFPAMTFDYNNLFASCKGGQPITIAHFPETDTTIEEIAKKFDVKHEQVKPKATSNFVPKRTKVQIQLKKKEDTHCDAHKEEKRIVIQPIVHRHWVRNPHDSNKDYEVFTCEGRISFIDDGTILIDNDEKHNTITILNLNVEYLKNERKKVIDDVETFIETLKEDSLTQDIFIKNIENKITDTQSSLQKAFAFVKVFFLNQEINPYIYKSYL